MGIKQKFTLLAGLVGVILAVVSVIGYYTAYTNLADSVGKEIAASLEAESNKAEGWLQQKAKLVTAEADLMTQMAGQEVDRATMRRMLSLAASDKDVQEMTRGDEQGMFLPYYNPDETGRTDPRRRPWYMQAKAVGKTVYTDVYQSKSTGDLVVSAVAPFYGRNDEFAGAICGDITLDVLKEQVRLIKYRGEGRGYIIENTGKLLATAGPEEIMTDANNLPGIGAHLSEMFKTSDGYFLYDAGQGEQVFAYTTVPSTKWIIGMSVPYDFVFGSVIRLKVTYAMLTLVGLLLMLCPCRIFASHITGPILALEERVASLAQGDLSGQDIPVKSADEIGRLTQGFNTMRNELRRLIGKVEETSEQVSAASEELSANAQQSANGSISVVESIGDISRGMDKQLQAVDGVKQGIDTLYCDIAHMDEQAAAISLVAEQAADIVRTLDIHEEHTGALLDMSEKIRQSSASMLEKVTAVSDCVNNIVTAMDEMDTVSRETSDHAQAISAVTEQQSASDEEIASASQSLAGLATDMQSVIHKFKL